MTAVALIVAAGRGERLGSSAPKALVALSGRPMLEWSVAALRAADGIGAIVVALPGDALDAAPAGCVAVAGGAERSHSVRAALAAAPGGRGRRPGPRRRAPAADARARRRAAWRALDEDGGWDAAIAAAPVTDTVKRAADGVRVTETLVRSELWAVQTPQVFRRAALERALSRPDAELAAATDDAMLVEQDGGRVRVVEAPAENLKVTTRGGPAAGGAAAGRG